MIRDFSKDKENQIITIVNKIHPDKKCIFDIHKVFNDELHSLVGYSIEDVDFLLKNYEKTLIDKKEIYTHLIKHIFSMIRYDDFQYGQMIRRLVLDNLASPLIIYLKELNKMINPNSGSVAFDSKRCNSQTLRQVYGFLIDNIKNNYKYIVYIDDGVHFGSYQGTCRNTWKDANGDSERKSAIKKIVLNHYPEMSDKKIGKLLSEMASEGCKYTALANTIFSKYIGDEAEFEKKFGFPMYDKNGYPNYDLVMLDFYCSEGKFDGIKYGLTKKTSETRWEHYLKNKDINVDVVNIKLSIDKFDEVSKKGEIIVSMRPIRLRNSSGNLVDTRDAGHAMTITDVVTINGTKMFKISSWGRVYYVNPSDFDKSMRLEYQQVRY